MSRPLTIFTLLVALAAVLSLTSAQHVQNKNCAKGVHIIAASGAGGAAGGYGGLLKDLVADILEKIPHSTAVSVPYDKGDTSDEKGSISGASSTFKRYVQNYVDSCPYGRVVLLGYSSGAMAAMNTLCGTSMNGWTPTPPLAASFNKNIIATVVYGDETYTPNQSYNKGSCTSQTGRLPRTKPACQPFAPHIYSYCDAHDDQCCPPGNNVDVHHMYNTRHDTPALNFVMQRHEATKKHPRYRNSHGGGQAKLAHEHHHA